MTRDAKLPAVIDVQPSEIHVERPRVTQTPIPQPPVTLNTLLVRARELQRIGRVVQTQDFWVGVLTVLIRGR